MDDYKGFHDYDWKDFDALDLHLRAMGSRPLKLGDLDYQKAEWDSLHKTRKACMRAAQLALQSLKDTDDESRAAKVERSHDVIMAALDVIDGEMGRRKGLGQTGPLSLEQRGVPMGGDGSAVFDANGGSRAAGSGRELEWRDNRGKPIRVLSPEQSVATDRPDGLGVGDIARAMIYGPKNDDERRALSEGTDSAGGYTVPTRLASYFIDKLRAKSVVFQAGAQTVPMDSDNLAIARVTGDPTVSWTAENAEITASDPTFDAVTLAPKKLAALVRISRELMEDSVNIGAALEAAFVGKMSEELDRALLFGSGSSNQPTGLFNVSGINSVSMGDNGAAPTNYDNLIDLLYEVQLDNGADPSVFILHPRTNRSYAKLKDANDNPMIEPEMTRAIRRLVTTAVPIDQDQGTATDQCSTVLTGDFSKMLVGVRRTMELRLLNERYAEYDQVAFLATLRADVAVEQPVHFGRLIGIKAA